VIQQYPGAGSHVLRFRGDVQRFVLEIPKEYAGSAKLRTNIGHAMQIRGEIIRSVQKELPPLGLDWFDIPMRGFGAGRFEVVVPLLEVGHFEAKCYFLPEGAVDPVWPAGANTVVNVEPAQTCCANIIYNVFVRQFGPDMHTTGLNRKFRDAELTALDKEGYTVIPPSGTFRDLGSHLDFIIGTLGCRFIQLLPIHPTPTTYARMGRFGSPYAALSFTAVDPALAEFDPHATPLEQFIELLDAVHSRHGKLILDIAINHTGWAADLHEAHPEWLSRDTDGRIEVPGAWGVEWADLTKLDYAKKELWQYVADVFLTWCRRGVDGFRCDAGYMIPLDAWRFIIAMVRDQYPDTIFLLEGLGGKPSVTRRLLGEGNFNWAYSELFQNYDRVQIESYLPRANETAAGDGVMVHFAETHDNPRLSARSKTWARLRTDLCALFAPYGAFGFTNGVEWFATEKINVHDAQGLNWGASDNQVAAIGLLTSLLKYHPAFHDRTELTLVQAGEGNHVALLRRHLPSEKRLLILANLDDSKEVMAAWDKSALNPGKGPLIDLLTEQTITPATKDGFPACHLPPGRVLCLSQDPEDIHLLGAQETFPVELVPRVVHQQLRAKALDVFCFCRDAKDIADVDPNVEARDLYHDPKAFCRKQTNLKPQPGFILWHWPRDTKREVMLPPGHFLLVMADTSFQARITEDEKTLNQEESLPTADGYWFALFSPLPVSSGLRRRFLNVSLFSPQGCRHATTPLLYLSPPESMEVTTLLGRQELLAAPRMFLATNNRGSMLRAPLIWGRLESRYDALLAANRSPKIPEDRWIMLTRCRCWIVYQAYSQALGFDCFHTFHLDPKGRGLWRFHVPTGQGEHVRITVRAEMATSENTLHLLFFRHPAEGREGRLADGQPVRLIVRPDVESRNFHHTTKAYLGPEKAWRQAVKAKGNGFVFMPEPECRLMVFSSGSRFVAEPEWHYMVHRPGELERGFDPDSDLFSPGYFKGILSGGQPVVFTAHVSSEVENEHQDQSGFDVSEKALYGLPRAFTVKEALEKALDRFVVRRGAMKTIIAGYPWFLDWGRDSLIVVRGLVAGGRLADARAVLRQFGQFEKDGMLPNMIAGRVAANMDTSDAPLWFFVACRDMVEKEGSFRFIDTQVGRRTIRDILFSIAESYMKGTENGVRMDLDTALVFSPAHFTWMDTNHPAGTPREGYPIEIQALWYHALAFLSQIDPGQEKGAWQSLAQKVQSAIRERFELPKSGYLSDCLHTSPGIGAAAAEADDYLRPNQLLAVTLGAVTDPELCRSILEACQELLIPGAVRSLADRPVRRPLSIVHNGAALNEPLNPYQGTYTGEEDTKRKPAYHNGTAWAWLMPSFCEAWVLTYGSSAIATAAAWLGSSVRLLSEGCLGQMPEILDGNLPHRQRGCDAQAWSVSELLRVWINLNQDE
jgi:predicted glycogen debranching enzyme